MKKIQEEIQPLDTDIHTGLNKEQVDIRTKNKLDNKNTSKVEKSYLKIILDNFLNSFNAILLSIALVFLFFVIYLNCIGHKDIADKYFGFSKFTFIIPVIINSSIGTIQEIRSKIMLRKINIINKAKCIVIRDGKQVQIYSDEIVLHDIVLLKAGDQIACDMIVKEGNIEVDESLLTGESDTIKKEKGAKLLSGSSVIIGSCYALVEKVGKETYASTLSEKVKKLNKQKSELLSSIYKLIKFLGIILIVISVIVLITMIIKIKLYGDDPSVWSDNLDTTYHLNDVSTWSRIVLVIGAFAIGVIPTGLVLLTSLTLALSIIKLMKQQTLIQDLFSLENLSRVDTLCLDKTGTLTTGSMIVEETIYFQDEANVNQYIQEFNYASSDNNQTAIAIKEKFKTKEIQSFQYEPFSSKTKSSILHLGNDVFILGAPEYLLDQNSKEYGVVNRYAKEGKRVLAFLRNKELIALFILKDNIRASAKETIEYFYENNLDIKIISGDNPLTVSKIASICGVENTDKYISLEGVELEDIPSLVDSYTIFARVSPEQKKAIIEALQNKGKKVGMTGDGVNDVLALRKANASITFNKATDAAKACSDVILLDDDFTHLKEVISQGRRVINNVQRTSILFLMKTICFVLLTILLIPFKKGQMWFSVENIYMMQNSVIAIGGFILSLEGTKNPIRGTFKENVFSKSLFAGILMALSALLPILLHEIPLLFSSTPIISASNVSTMISILTTITGFIVMFYMCMPINKYRLVAFFLSILSAILTGFAFPTSYIGGKVSTFSMFHSPDHNFFHSQFMKEFFRPWNSPSIIEFNKQALTCILTIVFFSLFIIGSYFLFNHYQNKKKKA